MPACTVTGCALLLKSGSEQRWFESPGGPAFADDTRDGLGSKRSSGSGKALSPAEAGNLFWGLGSYRKGKARTWQARRRWMVTPPDHRSMRVSTALPVKPLPGQECHKVQGLAGPGHSALPSAREVTKLGVWTEVMRIKSLSKHRRRATKRPRLQLVIWGLYAEHAEATPVYLFDSCTAALLTTATLGGQQHIRTIKHNICKTKLCLTQMHLYIHRNVIPLYSDTKL